MPMKVIPKLGYGFVFAFHILWLCPVSFPRFFYDSTPTLWGSPF